MSITKKRVVITGAEGLVGTVLRRGFPSRYEVVLPEMRATRASAWQPIQGKEWNGGGYRAQPHIEGIFRIQLEGEKIVSDHAYFD